MKKRLLIVLGTIVLLFSLAGCSNSYPEYHFNGQIGQERIRSSEVIGWNDSDIIISITKTDGSRILYIGKASDQKLLRVTIITADGTSSKYDYPSSDSRPAINKMMEEAPARFQEYLKKISELNTAPFYK